MYSVTMELKDILAALMERHHVTQNGLADATGVPQPTVFRILSGESKEPRRGTLLPLAEYFGVSIPQLMGEEPLIGETRSLAPMKLIEYSILPLDRLVEQIEMLPTHDVHGVLTAVARILSERGNNPDKK